MNDLNTLEAKALGNFITPEFSRKHDRGLYEEERARAVKKLLKPGGAVEILAGHQEGKTTLLGEIGMSLEKKDMMLSG